MSVNWITVAAQIVNFLVLIWLLKRFLYRPILDGIDRREAQITERMALAETAREEAEHAEAEHKTAIAALAVEKSAILDAARTQAEAESAKMRNEARETIDDEQAEWRRRVNAERTAYLTRLRDGGAKAILSLTRKALKDLADARLEDRIVARVESQLADLGPELLSGTDKTVHAVAVSSFPLDKARRDSMHLALNAVVKDVPLDFEMDPKSSPGLTLQLGGARVGWTVDSYLDGLENQLQTQLGAASPPLETTS